MITDSDSIVRRHLLAMNPPQPSNCSAYYAFSSQIALRYLQSQGFSVDFPTAQQWQIGEIRFNILNSHPGFYTTSQVKGHQIMLNYRRSQEIAPTVTLTQVLNHQVNPALIQNKIILIGVTDPSVKDYFKTPENQEIRGLHLHAHKISQLIRDLRKNRIPVIVEERRLPKAMLLDTITLKENQDDTSSNRTSYILAMPFRYSLVQRGRNP